MNAQQLRNSILQEAIQGRLVPQDPTDEPASVLLQRIRKEKERLVKEGKLKKKDLESKPIGADEIPFEIPKGWEWVRLKAISESILYGVSESAKVNGRYKLLRITDIQNNDVEWKRVPFTDFDEIKAKNYFLQKNDILFARTGGTVGKSYLVDNCPEDSIYASYLIRVRLIISVYSRYIKSFFESPAYWSQITDNLSGTGQPNCNGEKLSNLLIPLPPLSEQRRIVAKIEELLPLVEQYGKAQAELEDLNRSLPDKLKKSVLQEAIQGRLVPQNANDEPASELLKRFEKENKEQKGGKVKNLKSLHPINENEIPYQIPENWRWVRLGEIFFTTSGGTPLKGHPEYYENGNIPWIKSGDLKEKYLYCAETYITTEALKNSSAKYFPINTVAVAMYGATIGKTSIFKNELTTNQAVCGIFPNTIVLAEYLYYFILAKTSDYLSMAFGGAQPNISQEKIKKTLFPLPPLSEQRRIVAKIEELFAQIDKLKV